MKSAKDVSYDRKNSPVSKSDVKTTQGAIEDIYSRLGYHISDVDELISIAQQMGNRPFMFVPIGDLKGVLGGTDSTGGWGDHLGMACLNAAKNMVDYLVLKSGMRVMAGRFNVDGSAVGNGEEPRQMPTHFKAGSIDFTAPADSYKEYPVEYGDTYFDLQPSISVSLATTSTDSKMGLVSVVALNRTRTGFTARVFNNSGASLTGKILWQAMTS